MVLGDFLARLGGGREEPREQAAAARSPRPPTREDLLAALDATEDLVDGGAVPSPVTARALRVTAAVRDTLPRLDSLGAGSATAYAVMATATDYLPEAVNGYLRLPRRFADTRPVDAGKTSLMVLVDQLDLLGATMDRVFDAVHRDDATALVAHGRFLDEKFGSTSGGGSLELRAGETPLPEQPADEQDADEQGGVERGDEPRAAGDSGRTEPPEGLAVTGDEPPAADIAGPERLAPPPGRHS